MNARLATLLDVIDRAYDVRSWHGPNLRGALRGLHAEEAARRPAPGCHNAWEIAVHCAYWKYRVAYILDPTSPRTFDEKGSDWIARPAGAPDETVWKADLDRLGSWHALVRGGVESFDAARLDAPAGKNGFTYGDLITGIAAHDVYHAGQIRLVLRMLRDDG
jgi:uncharacterized damage-inducible protein DinB